MTSDLHQLALQKMSAVLGSEHASVLLSRTLGALGIERIESPQQLMELADALRPHGGFVAAVGAMLGVAAVLRGASPKPSGA